MAAIFTISCGGKEESKVPKSMDELWGTTWECKNPDYKKYPNQIDRVTFLSADSILLYTYIAPDTSPIFEPPFDIVILTRLTYIKPELFSEKYIVYDNGEYKDTPYEREREQPHKFCRFDDEGYLINNFGDYYTKVK